MSGHDRRCEWSKTPPARCRCSCHGMKHGTARVRQEVLGDQQAEGGSLNPPPLGNAVAFGMGVPR